MTHALLIVDVQNDFTEGGALGVAGGDAVAQGVTALLAENGSQYSHIIASRDWHSPVGDNGGHFADDPDFVDTWPPHCVADTVGAEYHPALNTAAITHHIRKGYGEPAYSAFEGTLDTGKTLHELITADGITTLDVVGIATDHCVFASATHALEAGLRVRVHFEYVAGVGELSSAQALESLARQGAEIITR